MLSGMDYADTSARGASSPRKGPCPPIEHN